jgi:hypothetical protein
MKGFILPAIWVIVSLIYAFNFYDLVYGPKNQGRNIKMIPNYKVVIAISIGIGFLIGLLILGREVFAIMIGTWIIFSLIAWAVHKYEKEGW